MTFTEFKNAVIVKAQAMGLTDYELYYEYAESTDISVFQHEICEFSASTGGGVCFRAIVNDKMGYASTEALTEAEASAIVERAVDNASILEADEPVFLGEGGKTYQALDKVNYDLPNTDALIHMVLDAQEKLYATDEAVIDGSQSQIMAGSSRLAIYNSKGLDLQYENNMVGLVLAAVVTDGTEKSDDYQLKVGAPDTIDVNELAAKAVDGAKAKLGGEVAPTGNYPVVFNPDAMASLLQVFSGIFSSEAAQKGLSKLGGKEGQVIAAPIVTLVDDPFYCDSATPMPFDAEGTPTYKKNIIENGVFKTLLYNMKTAAVAGVQTTGNASKGGYDAPVGIRPFTFHLAPGQYTEEQLLEKAGNGVYINALQGLHAGANAVTGDFSLQSSGFMIENGNKTIPVRSFTVAGNFYELLKNITAISDQVILPWAVGKTAFGAPCVLAEGLSIAGK